ncbi:uncharacterized protein LOC125861030 [Solanum stenotomum]|uniref:uncharacterized protein LOC125861030 n=1 Tax=Solanum stenotomum TaxID=172797 RepID=UPI0020D0CED6|nr:uncharacterized protein LOC125861030 [Solanum stenotomum]
MMPLLFSSSSYLSFFLVLVIIIIYFPSHPSIARKSLPNKAVLEELYFSYDSSRLENMSPKGIAKRSIQDFQKENNYDTKVTFSGSEMIGSDLSLSALPHAVRLLKAAKTKGARWSTTHEMHMASKSGNKKNLYGDIIEMDYDPPHRKLPIHN